MPMRDPRPAQAKARAQTRPDPKLIVSAWGLLIALLFVLLSAVAALANDTVIKSHGISTFGELKYPADFAHLDYVNPDAPKGGEISEWGFGTFDTFNPYTVKGRAAGLSSAPYESLLGGTADEIGASYGLIAESMEYPESRDWVIFNLRDDVRFSDGTPLTVDDVIFSYETFRDKGLPSFRKVLKEQVQSAEKLGDLRVKFTFMPDFPKRDLPQTVGGLPIFSKADFEANGHDLEETTLTPFIGSGPYVLESYDIGKRVTYRRNPDYWGNDLPLNVGQNNFDAIRLEYYGDYLAAFEGFKAGNYTFRNEASSKTWATGYDFPALEKGWVKKATPTDGDIATGQAFVFNLRRPQFQDPLVRQAIGLMFNFEWSNESLFYGVYARVNSFWDNSPLAAQGLPSPEELALLEPIADLLPSGVLDQPAVMAPVSGTRQLDRKNLRAASALLDQAGWLVDDDGLRRKDGKTLTVEFLNDSQSFDRVINPYVENLKRLGIDAKMERVDTAQMTDRERSYDFDIITDSFSQGYTPGSGLKQYFGSASADTSVFNKAGLKSPAVDALIDVVLAAQTRADLNVAVQALDRVLRAERFVVPQWFKDTYTVAYYDIFDHPENLPPYALGELSFWWYNADKAKELKAAGATF